MRTGSAPKNRGRTGIARPLNCGRHVSLLLNQWAYGSTGVTGIPPEAIRSVCPEGKRKQAATGVVQAAVSVERDLVVATTNKRSPWTGGDTVCVEAHVGVVDR